jgi:hypothetical protein
MRVRAAVFGCLALLAGCNVADDIPKATAQIDAFHSKLNAGDFATIYAQSAPEMKQAATEDALTKLLSAVHRKLGDFQSGQQQSWNDNVNTSGHFLTLGYAAKYAHGDATETFVYKLDGQQTLLVGYNVNSNALIEN